MSLYFRSFVLLCFLFGAASSELFAQGRSSIVGYVFGAKRSPVSEVEVELRNDVNRVIGRTRTDGSGRYSFFGVPNGRVSVTVLPLRTNFETQTQEVDIAGIGARGQLIPENVQLDFYLRPRKGSDPTSDNAVIFFQEVPDEAKQAYQSAIAHLDGKRTNEGIAELERALTLLPSYFAALERLGVEQMNATNYDGAIKSFTSALSVNKRSFVSRYGLGYSNFAVKKWDAAIDAAEKALELEKNSVPALIVLGISQRSLKRFDEAERSLVRAKKLDDGKTADLYWNLALLYAHNLKKYQEAADALEAYLKANPSIPDATNIKKLIKQFRENRPPSD